MVAPRRFVLARAVLSSLYATTELRKQKIPGVAMSSRTRLIRIAQTLKAQNPQMPNMLPPAQASEETFAERVQDSPHRQNKYAL